MLFPFYIFGFQLSFKISKLTAFCSKMDDEHKERERIKIFEKVKCLDCQCFGNLRTTDSGVVLLPLEVLSTRSILTQKNDLKKPISYKETPSKKFKISEQ